MKEISEFDTPDKYAYHDRGILFDLLRTMFVGDSITFYVPSDFLFERIHRKRPPFIKPGSEVKYTIKIVKVQTEDQMKKEKELQENSMLEADNRKINEYIAQNRIPVRKTSSGIRFKIDSVGFGSTPQMGDIVVLEFRSSLLDGTFLTSSEQTGEPMEFPADEGLSLPGLEQSVKLLKEGGAGVFIIPSVLAYGKKGIPGFIPPDANIIFELYLKQIKGKTIIEEAVNEKYLERNPETKPLDYTTRNESKPMTIKDVKINQQAMDHAKNMKGSAVVKGTVINGKKKKSYTPVKNKKR